MAKGMEIVLTAFPKGVFKEGIISGTLKPGVQVSIKAGVLPVGGRHTWEAYNGDADGDPRLCCVLMADDFQGKTATDAYVSGTRCKMYCPLPGEEMNMLVAGQAGTGSANVFSIGERLIPDAGTGKLLTQPTSASNATFESLEYLTEVPNVDTLVWCQKT